MRLVSALTRTLFVAGLAPGLALAQDASLPVLDVSSLEPVPRSALRLPDADEPGHPPRPDSHAPIGVMGDHLHRRGEWMVAYRYMRMEMDGNRDGTSSVSTSEVLSQFMVAPLNMDMDMHMVGGMYGLSDDVTLTAMVPFVSKTMDHVTGTAVEFTTDSDGIGDVKLGGLVRLFEGDSSDAHLNLALSLPTGDIDAEHATPASGGAPVQLPYPMQLGSGTYDAQVGGTWVTYDGDWSFGAQALQTFRIGENDHGYKLGNRSDATAWTARRLTESWSASLRLAGARWGNVHGMDDELGAMPTVPTKVPGLRGGKRVDVLLGVNAYAPDGPFAGHRLAIEAGVPAWQDLAGPQLETDFVLTVGWQYAP